MDPLSLMPEDRANDVRAIRSMSQMAEMAHAAGDTKTVKDLGNRIAQAMGRLADWEDANPDLARKVADAAAANTDT